MNSLTVKELMALLKQCPVGAKVFVSSDSEGNAYGSLNHRTFDFCTKDNVVILGMYQDNLLPEQIIPKLIAEADLELDALLAKKVS